MAVLEMLKYHVPSVVILLTLLVQWNLQIPHRVELLLQFIMFSSFHDTIHMFDNMLGMVNCVLQSPSRTKRMLYPLGCIRTGISWRCSAAVVKSAVLWGMCLGTCVSNFMKFLLNPFTKDLWLQSWRSENKHEFTPSTPSSCGSRLAWLAPHLIHVWMKLRSTSHVLLPLGALSASKSNLYINSIYIYNLCYLDPVYTCLRISLGNLSHPCKRKEFTPILYFQCPQKW